MRRTPPGPAGGCIPEPESASRNPFRRDADRIIHSTAFRRLKHKTQVFVFHEGDHYRTRLTHTLEVTQIARALARSLGLDEDLAEALALAHDLGHPPFGHAGERALDALPRRFRRLRPQRPDPAHRHRHRAALSGFRRPQPLLGNARGHRQAQRAADRRGRQGRPAKYRENGVPQVIADYNAAHDLALWSHAGAEAQVAAIADDIAYDAHDLDDGLRADLFAISRSRRPAGDRRAAARGARPVSGHRSGAADPRAGAPPDRQADRGRDRRKRAPLRRHGADLGRRGARRRHADGRLLGR